MVRRRSKLIDSSGLRHMRRAGLVVADIHDALRAAVGPGRTTSELDAVSAGVIEAAGAYSNFLGYHGFPATVCISVNEEVVHGIPGPRVLERGDVVSFDCGAYVLDEAGRQWHADACFTTIVGGWQAGSAADQDLVRVTDEARDAAIARVARQLAAGTARVDDVGQAVEEVVERHLARTGVEYGIPLEFTGHGIGNELHTEPDVLNYRTRGRGPKLHPGMAICIEPMLIDAGDAPDKDACIVRDDGWTAVSRAGGRAAHSEHTVALVKGGVWVLTARDGGATLLAPYGLAPVEPQ